MIKVCELCGLNFEVKTGSKRKFCSRECQGLAQRKRVDRLCLHCGKPFIDFKGGVRKFCSKECHDQSRELWYTCQNCGKQYHPGANGGKKYCSRTCSGAARTTKIWRPCQNCGKEFLVYPNSIQRLCSQKCNWAITHKPRLERGLKIEIECKQCHKKFITNTCLLINVSNNSKKRYCSRACKGAAKKGTRWPIEKTNKILYTCQECGQQWYDQLSQSGRKKYCSRECVGAATIKRLALKNPTSIELEIYQALTEMGLIFEPQCKIGHWLADCYVPALNLIIECQGDFHHCNPIIYPDGPKYKIQQRSVDRDRRKAADYADQGYTALFLWETDIKAAGAKNLLLQHLPNLSP